MKKENSTLNKRLKQYSAVATSVLSVTGMANAQVVYTDIIPDTIISATSGIEEYGLDLDNNGLVDYKVQALGYSAGTHIIDFLMYPYTGSNAIAGNLLSFPSGGVIGKPYALSLNDNIDNNLNFFSVLDLVNSASSFYPPLMVFVSSAGSGYGPWAGGMINHFLGLRIVDGGNTYYGWARCDIPADATTITVKDYAYNSTPNTPVFAGEGLPLGMASTNQSVNFQIFGYEGMVNVFVNDGKTDGATVTMINMIGETLLKQNLVNRHTRLDLNQFAKGIYMITVQRGEEIFSKKISFR